MSRTAKDDALTAGYFNRRITLQTPGPVQDDGQGGGRPAYTSMDLWAHVDTGKAGRQATASPFAGQIYPTNHATITIRYRAGVAPNIRVLYKGRVYKVQEVTDPHESQIALELYCVEYQEKGS